MADVYIVSVQPPYDKFTKKAGMSYVNAAIDDVLKAAAKSAIVAVETTISPGSIDRYVRSYDEEKGFKIEKKFHFVHAPEHIIPGNMIYEFFHNNRMIGVDDREIDERVAKIICARERSQLSISRLQR